MAETPWTPGPWAMRDHGIVNSRLEPCLVFPYPRQPVYRLAELTQADARLIALAPEMAELLTLISVQGTTVAGIAARDLLARARGDIVPAPASPS